MDVYKGVTGAVYDSIIKSATHLLIGGTTGAGKSTVSEGLINSLLYLNPAPALYLCDPKSVDLWQFSNMKNVLEYTDEISGAKRILYKLVDIMEARKLRARAAGLKESNERPIYLIIDELADLVLQDKEIFKPLQRLLAKGRAMGIRCILLTQLVNCAVLPTLLRANIGTIICLRCASPLASRLMIDNPAAANLPKYGKGYIKDSEGLRLVDFPLIPPEHLAGIIKFWQK